MKLNIQKKLAGKILKASPKRVKLDPARGEDIKEAITKADLKSLIAEGAITKKQKKGVSRARANKILRQKRKGQRKNAGSRKGKATARQPKKEAWMNKIRKQREFLKELKQKGYLESKTYNDLYKKAKGGFFRSKNHIKLYMDEHKLIKK